MRSWRRRPSMKPENIKRRMGNRVAKVVAALVLAAAYAAWNTWFAPAGSEPSAPGATEQAAAPATTDAPAAGSATKPARPPAGNANADDGLAAIDALYEARRSNEMVTVHAPVKRVLADDNQGSRHQKFLIALPSGRNLLIAHNIDLAPRVENLAAGDLVTVRGEYEWEERGGVLHWTHHDPAGRHQGGWIDAHGKRHE